MLVAAALSLATLTTATPSTDAPRIQRTTPDTTAENTIASHILVHGDIVFGGLFPVHERGTDQNPCAGISEGRGVHRVEAMLYAIDRINADTNILPGIRIGAEIYDTCGAPAYALNQSLAFVRDRIGTSDADQYVCPASGTRPTLRREHQPKHVAAVVGGSYSGVSIQVANLLRLFKVVQVSYASTNADLSDKTRYEYFARTVPSDNFQARVMVDIAAHYKWNYVILVFSAGGYGELGAHAFKIAARQAHVCISDEYKISKKDDINDIVDKVMTSVKSSGLNGFGPRVVILFTRNDDLRLLLQGARDYNVMHNEKTKPVWLASEAWEMQPSMTAGVEDTAHGALVLSLSSNRVSGFDKYYLSHRPGSPLFKRNAWLKELWISKYECIFDGDTCQSCRGAPCDDAAIQEEFQPDNKVQFVIDAVYALAYALHDKWQAECREREQALPWILNQRPPLCDALQRIDGQHFYSEYLLRVAFNDTSGSTFSFSANGDGPAKYKIFNFKNYRGERTYEEVGEWSSTDNLTHMADVQWPHGALPRYDAILSDFSDASAGLTTPRSICSTECGVGEVKQTAGTGHEVYCCWTCRKCEAHQYVDNGTCINCTETHYPTKSRDRCEEMPQQHMRWGTAYSIVPVVIATAGIILTLFFNDSPIVKASGRELSYMLLIAIIVCYSMTFVLLTKPTPFSCALRRVGIGFGFALLYSSMLVKTNRIYRIFHYAKRNISPGYISPLSQVVIALGLAGVQLFGSAIWLLAQPPTVTSRYPDRATRVLKCAVDDALFLVSFVYDTALIVACTVFAVLARRVPENFNEAKFIGFTMYTTLICWLASVPIFFGTGSDFQTQTTTLCVSISLSATVTLVLIFSPKLYIIFFEPEKNVRKQAGDKMLSARAGRNSNLGGEQQTFENRSARLATAHANSPLLGQQSAKQSVDLHFARKCPEMDALRNRHAQEAMNVDGTPELSTQSGYKSVVGTQVTYKSFESPSLNSMNAHRNDDFL